MCGRVTAQSSPELKAAAAEQEANPGIVVGSNVRVTKLDNVEMWIDPSVEVGSIGTVGRIDPAAGIAGVEFAYLHQNVPLEWLELVN